MVIRLDPELEKILAVVYKAEKESPDQTFHVTGPEQLKNLGLDPDARARYQKFNFLQEQGFLIDVGYSESVSFYHVQLTELGRRYCEQHQLA